MIFPGTEGEVGGPEVSLIIFAMFFEDGCGVCLSAVISHLF